MSDVIVEGLTKRFDGRAVVDGLGLQVHDGEFFVMLGASGCGKTTTLRCIAGLEEADGGRIAIGGEVVGDATRGLFVPPHKRDIGMVFQSYALWPHLNVHDNVAYPLKLRRRGVDVRTRVGEALALVGLSDYGARYPGELSGGQQQRVALARAVAAQPRLLLFDEPLSNLDAQLRLRLRQDLRRIHRDQGSTSLYVTHDQAEALSLADRIAVMRDGRVEQVGTPDQIFLEPATRFVAEFVGFDNLLQGVYVGEGSGTALIRPDGASRTIPVAADRASGHAPGDRVTLALRSSSIRVLPAGADVPGIAVRLDHVAYLGDVYQCGISLGGVPLAASMRLEDWGRAAHRDAALPGTEVRAVLAQDAIVVLPSEAVGRAERRPVSALPVRSAVSNTLAAGPAGTAAAS